MSFTYPKRAGSAQKKENTGAVSVTVAGQIIKSESILKTTTPPRGALSRERVAVRPSELAEMFHYIKQNVENPETVRGGSWLYNIEAYRRLFPTEYIRSAQDGGYEFQFIALWGQFVDRRGKVKGNLARKFIECLGEQTTLIGLERCFPYRVLRPECPIQFF